MNAEALPEQQRTWEEELIAKLSRIRELEAFPDSEYLMLLLDAGILYTAKEVSLRFREKVIRLGEDSGEAERRSLLDDFLNGILEELGLENKVRILSSENERLRMVAEELRNEIKKLRQELDHVASSHSQESNHHPGQIAPDVPGQIKGLQGLRGKNMAKELIIKSQEKKIEAEGYRDAEVIRGLRAMEERMQKMSVVRDEDAMSFIEELVRLRQLRITPSIQQLLEVHLRALRSVMAKGIYDNGQVWFQMYQRELKRLKVEANVLRQIDQKLIHLQGQIPVQNRKPKPVPGQDEFDKIKRISEGLADLERGGLQRYGRHLVDIQNLSPDEPSEKVMLRKIKTSLLEEHKRYKTLHHELSECYHKLDDVKSAKMKAHLRLQLQKAESGMEQLRSILKENKIDSI